MPQQQQRKPRERLNASSLLLQKLEELTQPFQTDPLQSGATSQGAARAEVQGRLGGSALDEMLGLAPPAPQPTLAEQAMEMFSPESLGRDYARGNQALEQGHQVLNSYLQPYVQQLPQLAQQAQQGMLGLGQQLQGMGEQGLQSVQGLGQSLGQSLQGLGQQGMEALAGLPEQLAGAGAGAGDPSSLAMRAAGLGQGIPTSVDELLQRALGPYDIFGLGETDDTRNMLNRLIDPYGVGTAINKGLGITESPAVGAAGPGFDLQAAQALMGQPESVGAFGPGPGMGGPSGESVAGAGVLSQIIGPAPSFAVPPAIQEPLPPELDLAPVRSAFMKSQPAGTPEEDMQSLMFSNVLQGIGQFGAAGVGGPIGETLLRAGLGGLTGLGAGKGAQTAVRAEDRQAQEEFQRQLAEFELGSMGAEREAGESIRQTKVRNLERERAAKLQQQEASMASRQVKFLGMTPSGPAFQTNEGGQAKLSVYSQPPSEVDRMEAYANVVTAQAAMKKAEGESSSIVDPSLAGTNAYLVKVADELVRTGGYSRFFEPDELNEMVEDVRSRLGGVPAGDPEAEMKQFNSHLMAALVERISQDPNLLQSFAGYSTTAARLVQAERLAQSLQEPVTSGLGPR